MNIAITWNWPTVIGIIGILLVLLAFFLLQSERLHGNRIPYQLMNAVGSACVIVSLVYQFNLPSMVLEIAWCAIAIYGIVRGFRRRRMPR